MTPSGVRTRFIRRVTLGYAVAAAIWIFLSDRLLSEIADISSITWLSTVKGIAFVIVTSMLLHYALRLVPDTRAAEQSTSVLEVVLAPRTGAERWPRWVAYAFAVAITLVMVGLREGIPVPFDEASLLSLFVFPIILSALLGGLGPGLAATMVAALGAGYFAMPPAQSFMISSPHDLFSWGMLIANGVLVSVLSEGLHRLRRRVSSNHHLLDAVVSGSADAIFVKDRAGRYLLCNEAAARFIGRPATEIVGQYDTGTFPANVAQNLATLDSAIMERGERQTYEESLVTLAGENRTLLVTKGPLVDADGKTVGLFGIARDITDRKRSEARLRKSREELGSLIEQAPVAIAMFDRDMRYLATSRRWVEEYGRGYQELTGLSHYEVHPDLPERWKQFHREGLAGEIVSNDEDLWVRDDGGRSWLRWAIHPWHDAQGDVGGIIIFAEDITKRREAEEEVRRLNVELEHRVHTRTAELRAANEELDSFAYAVSHDLRAPLRAMNGFSHALLEDFGNKLDGTAKTYLAQIIHASQRMGELIDGLLTLSRSTRRELRRDPSDLSEMSQSILAELARSEPQREVAWSVEPGLAAEGDSRTIDLVLRNLIGNAWKYTAKTDKPHIRVYAEVRDGTRFFCVTDNGAGFDMTYANKLFQPFQRLHRQEEFPGIGIGLATVQRIVHRHGGKILATGAPGQGATFRFSLPLADLACEEPS